MSSGQSGSARDNILRAPSERRLIDARAREPQLDGWALGVWSHCQSGVGLVDLSLAGLALSQGGKGKKYIHKN